MNYIDLFILSCHQVGVDFNDFAKVHFQLKGIYGLGRQYYKLHYARGAEKLSVDTGKGHLL